MVPSILAQPFFEKVSLCAFPAPSGRNHNQWIMHTGDELATMLDIMPSGRPADIERKCTYPCVVMNGNVQRGPRLKIQPLIGTADNGIYLRPSDIAKLDLEYMGYKAETRQGTCRVYSGVRFKFPNDYNCGKASYTTLHVFELPEAVALGERANRAAGANAKKYGIIGVPLLAKHVVFMHLGNTHVIDLSLVATSPLLRRCFERMNPVNSSQSRGAALPGNALEVALAIANRYSPPPFSIYNAIQNAPAPMILDICRVCRGVQGENGVRLSICARCTRERRPHRALYCGRVCQMTDWRERHKAEHAGEREWEREGAMYDIPVIS